MVAWPWYLGRVKKWKDGEDGVGPVVYWMSRDHRSRDNWALLHAVHQARKKGVPVAVAFNLVDNFLGAKARHFGFMLRGLRVVERNLMAVNIPFFLLRVRLFSQNCSSHLLLPSGLPCWFPNSHPSHFIYGWVLCCAFRTSISSVDHNRMPRLNALFVSLAPRFNKYWGFLTKYNKTYNIIWADVLS